MLDQRGQGERRVAYLCSAELMAGAGDPADQAEHRLQERCLTEACAARGIALETRAWNDSDLTGEGYAAAVLGTAWDYVEAGPEFLSKLELISGQTRVWNPIPLIRWNRDKSYLREVEERGIAIAPTHWVDAADESSIEEARSRFPGRELVIKPRVGAGAWRQVRLASEAPIPEADALPPAEAMIQPFLESASSEGEYSLPLLR